MMAERQSKIPRYARTEIPVASLGYKKTLRKVSDIREKVGESQQKIKVMKEDLSGKRTALISGVCGKPGQVEQTCATATVSNMLSSGSSQTVRRVILTPGGTKRKGKQFV